MPISLKKIIKKLPKARQKRIKTRVKELLEEKFEILKCPYCGCKALHADSLQMCCSKAVLKTLGR